MGLGAWTIVYAQGRSLVHTLVYGGPSFIYAIIHVAVISTGKIVSTFTTINQINVA